MSRRNGGTAQSDWRSIQDEREKYAAYLCSREWNVKKEAVKKRANGLCERCRVNPIDSVHHLTYARKYDEPLEDLRAICNGCHEFTHGKSDHDPAGKSIRLYTGKRIFLAGAIRSGDWREKLSPKIGAAVGGIDDLNPSTPPASYHFPVLQMPFGIRGEYHDGEAWYLFDYTGPFHIPLSCDDDPQYEEGLHDHGWGDETHRFAIRNAYIEAIARSDLFLAWFSGEDDGSTLIDLGIALRSDVGVYAGFASQQVVDATWYAASHAGMPEHMIVHESPLDFVVEILRGTIYNEIDPDQCRVMRL